MTNRRGSGELVERVRAANDVVSVIGGYLRLKKSGKHFKALCPFHKEKTPSFLVNPERQTYHCFGCQKGGDVFRFVMEMDGCEFPEALRTLAARGGIDIDREWQAGKPDSERELGRRVLDFAGAWYRKELGKESGQAARRYLEKRGIDEELIEAFGIGFVPAGWRNLRDAARRKGITDATLLHTGLVIRKKEGSVPYDRFRERVIFPIRDTAGRTIGFGGRVLGNEEPKYLNSPETPFFKKGEALYGIAVTRSEIRNSGTAVLVEGYTDLISLWANGIRNVVAPLGTALTSVQSRLIGNYARRAVMLFDGDEAGLRATLRSLAVLSAEGVAADVAILPAGVDPDSLVRDEGSVALQERIDAAKSMVSFVLEYPFPGGRDEAIRALVPVLAAVRDEIRLGLLIQEAYRKTGIGEDVFTREIRAERQSAREERVIEVIRRPGSTPRLLDAERGIAYLAYEYPDLLPIVRGAVGPEEVRDIPARKLLKELLRCADEGTEPSPSLFTLTGTDDAFSEVRVLSETIDDPIGVLGDFVKRIREDAINRQMKACQEELRDAEDREDGDACERILKDLWNLATMKKKIAYANRREAPATRVAAAKGVDHEDA